MSTTQQLENLLSVNEAIVVQLQANNDSLRGHIDALRAAAGRPPLRTIRFMELPTELRTRIYDLNMGSGKVFFPPTLEEDTRYQDRDGYDEPNWSLLQTGQEVRDEAADTLFANNTIIVSTDYYDDRILNSWNAIAGGVPDHQLDRLLLAHLRRISITFDFRDKRFGDIYFLNALRPSVPASRRRKRYPTDESKISASHEAGLGVYSCHWSSLLNLMTEYSPKLRWLQIDLTYCNCEQGCHRLVDRCVGPAIDYASFGSPNLETIEVLGTQHRSERDLITSRLARRLYEHNFFDRQDGDFEGAHRAMKLRYKRFDYEQHRSSTIHGYTVDTVDDMADEEVDLETEVEKCREMVWQESVNWAVLRVIEHDDRWKKPWW
ncbi:hypothetical protein CLAFUW4_05220 [Fulvia fulva]|uniref:Uncharacterized protein n=1 Tax=Passalora fulva TaxID=5499 RepID=A0A9Q8PHE7_PASFU|nr:uncharacterized protein CLAFUR5_11686 [Fulvia fulva]KAK4626948.1 hypothetical protein CLAFUR4_05206 [Fulvia fulva]KAK4628097.1 hypothetical protein CLAFUR0_05212 [Fulvia fulva]UJO22513.1 hypothetical protein CLAFUR5_11686 [Fulvia fulva]WPV13111.1 hypothetical protein CLAFUW4_05220 [Fulvia fulva]WPV28598.1 hypothetical protein CLAFUW7_05216 [Fulvia fulva]